MFSGIEAATVAWHPLGWEPVAFAEIEPFPSAVLAHHYPDVPNLGDITKVDWSRYAGTADLVCGGSPCQAFSVAGLRQGLADPRGNLALEYLRAVDGVRPEWVVWENVPGVLSVDGGRAFGAFLGGLAELGYGFAYRVLDAQYVRVESHPRAVPQRRRRVFVVGCLGDWRRAAAVLLERESLRGHPAPSREAGASVAGTLEARASTGGYDPGDGAASGHLIPEVAAFSAGQSKDAGSLGYQEGVSPTLRGAASGTNQVPTALIPEVSKASEDGTGRGVPVMAVRTANTSANGHGIAEGVAHTLDQAQGQAVAIHENQQGVVWTSDVAQSLNKGGGKPGQGYPAIQQGYAVRRLTPLECERLQGFPDGLTDVPYRGKQAADGPRYKAIGNSMAVNVMSFIGQRIEAAS